MGLCSSKEPKPPAANGTVAAKRGAAQQQAAKPAQAPPAPAPERDDANEIKVLLLGSGESGKSTIVKQMKIIHQGGYTREESMEYRPFVFKNVLDCIKSVINAIIDLEPDLIAKGPVDASAPGTPQIDGSVMRPHVLDYDDLNAILDYEVAIDQHDALSPAIAARIKKLYETPEVLSFMKLNQGRFYLIDSTQYFMQNIDRIASAQYIPNTDDILRTRKKTSGIYDFRFQMGNGLKIHMYDVGGQRSERKKWIHCFDNVTLIIFCVALSEYDQVLLEENSQNRLEESLTLFDSVVNSRWFARTSIVLFLNKIDVFADKLKYSPLENHFPDYTGGDNINKAAKYILWRFTQQNRSGLNIYPHVTQATDTSNIQLVFAAVKETILENSLKDSGLL
ncbi:guanine nucleotide-binding protein alpha-2 subunit [Diutina catenulata]